MFALFFAVLAASLLGSLHCVGMCGGFVLFCTGGDAKDGKTKLWVQAAYNGGRLVTYTSLGALAGSLGQALNFAGDTAGLQKPAAAISGALMIAWGTVALLRALDVKIPALPLPGLLQRAYRNVLNRLHGKSMLARAAIIGLASTLLPCGWLYAFVVTAAGTGSWLWGALTMAAFWLGTLPVLIGVGTLAQQMTGPLRRHLPAITALCVMGVGLLALTHRLQMPPVVPSVTRVSLPDAVAHVHDLGSGSTRPACCHDDN